MSGTAELLRGYVASLRHFTKNNQVFNGRALHRELVAAGVDRNCFVGNFVVQMFSRFGSIEEAEAAFCKIDKRNEISWNVMLTAFAANGNMRRAVWVMNLMPFWSVVSFNSGITAYYQLGFVQEARETFDAWPERDEVSWGALVAAYAHNGYLDLAKLVFEKAPGLNLVVWNSMITAYGRAGDLQQMKTMFDSLPDKNIISWTCLLVAYVRNGHLQSASEVFCSIPVEKTVISWNVMISAFASSNHGKKALQFFREMDLDGVQPSNVSLVSALDACSSLGITECRMIHEHIRESQFRSNTELGNVCMNMFARFKSVKDARFVFDEMSRRDVISWTTLVAAYGQQNHSHLDSARNVFDRMPQRSIVSWNTMMNSYARHGHLHLAVEMFDLIPEPDVYSWNIVLTLYAQNGDVDQAKEVFDEIPCPNLACCNAMLAAYAQNGYSREGVKFFWRMEMEGVKPSSVTLVSALDACAGCFNLSLGKLLHSRALSEGFELEGPLGSSLLNMYGRCGRLETAGAIFSNLRIPNSVSWNAIISGFAHDGQSKAALEMFRSMLVEGFDPSRVTFVCLLSVCSQLGELSICMELIRGMKLDFGLQPGADHYACVVDVISRSGELENAEQLVRSIQTPDENQAAIGWKILLGASRNLGHGEVGGRAYDQVMAFQKPQSGGGDSTAYVLLSNMFATAGEQNLME